VIGTSLAHYEILGLLGECDMGQVGRVSTVGPALRLPHPTNLTYPTHLTYQPHLTHPTQRGARSGIHFTDREEDA
jgi:hypothetical protein